MLIRRLLARSPLPVEVWAVTTVNFFVAVGFGMVAPAIPLFAREFGVGNLAAGAVISVFALMRFVSALWSGRLVDRTGERIVLASGIGIVAVSSLLAGFAQTYQQLLLLRGIGGVGSAMFTVAAVSLLLRVVGPDLRAQASGTAMAGFLLGAVMGPAFGGPLAEISLRLPFFVYTVTLTIAGTVGLVALRRAELRNIADAPAPVEPMAVRTALAEPAYRAAVTTNFLNGWTTFGLRTSLIPVFVVEGLSLGASWIGFGLVVSALVQTAAQVPAGRLSDRRGRKPFLMLGVVLGLVSMLLLVVTDGSTAYLTAMAVFGASSAFIGTSSAAVVGDVIHGRGGRPVAVYQMASDAGTFIGPLAAGWLSDSYDYSTAFLVTAGVASLAVVTVARMPETRHIPGSEHPEPTIIPES
jgi:MFS family permease